MAPAAQALPAFPILTGMATANAPSQSSASTRGAWDAPFHTLPQKTPTALRTSLRSARPAPVKQRSKQQPRPQPQHSRLERRSRDVLPLPPSAHQTVRATAPAMVKWFAHFAAMSAAHMLGHTRLEGIATYISIPLARSAFARGDPQNRSGRRQLVGALHQH